MEVYLDNAATTKPLEAAIEKSQQIYRTCYGNASSQHGLGIAAEHEINSAAKLISAACGCEPDEVFFNSGGTEGDNTTVFGVAKARARRGRHIITTTAEHPAVSQPIKILEDEGFEITRLGVDVKGRIDLDELASAVRKDTILVSVHHVNNETGALQDIASAAHVVKEKNPGAVFHSDGVQALGKIAVDLKNVDLYTLSAHKLHALKGVGALIVKKNTRILPLLYGGGQQNGFRSGTENTAGIAAFALAACECEKNMAEAYKHVAGLKARLIEFVKSMPDTFINGDETGGSPYILNMSFVGIRAEVMLHALESEGVYVSAGSACSSRKRTKNILENYGVGPERAESAIRISFSRFNTVDEIDYCIEAIKKSAAALRRNKA